MNVGNFGVVSVVGFFVVGCGSLRTSPYDSGVAPPQTYIDTPELTEQPLLIDRTISPSNDTPSQADARDAGTRDANSPTPAGGPCTQGGSECGDLMCQDVGASGFCTGTCTEGTTEQIQCGGLGSTCLTQGDGTNARSFCTQACTPSARSGATGACRAGTVCTGWWYTHAMGADDPGCFPFCGANSGSAGTTPVCNVRTGSCAATGVDMTRLPDGLACNPTMTVMVPGETTARNIQCRGVCFGISSTNRTRGSLRLVLESRRCRCHLLPGQPLRHSASRPDGQRQPRHLPLQRLRT